MAVGGDERARRDVRVTFGEQPAAEVLYHDYDYAAREAWGPWLTWAIVLVLLVVIAHAMSSMGTWLWGDDVNVTDNVLLRSWRGVWSIWRLPHYSPQFSPLGYTLLLCEQQLWGPHAARAMHLGNIGLHATSALLLWTLLRKLSIRGAWLAAAVFALHPIQVQTVAWISQQPTLLGAIFTLGAAIVWARFAGINPEPPPLPRPARMKLPAKRWILYAVALVLYLLAITAQPAAAVLPLVMLVLIWWRNGKLTQNDVMPILPMLAVSAVVLVGTVLLGGQTRFDWSAAAAAGAHPISGGPMERVLIASRAIWFYAGSIVFPWPLAFTYPRWAVDSRDPLQYFYPAAVIIVLGGLWLLRSRLRRAPFAAAGIFVLLVLPAACCINLPALRDSFVADSGAYLAVAAIVTPIVSWLVARFGPAEEEHLSGYQLTPWLATAALVGLLGATIYYERPYLSEERLWADATAKYPGSVFAQNSLGRLELARKDSIAAMSHFRQASEIEPTNVITMVNIGRALEAGGNVIDAIGQFYRALNVDPNSAEAHLALAEALARQGSRGEAVREYQTVLRLRDGNSEAAHVGLARIDEQLGNIDAARQQYIEALRINPRAIDTRIELAVIYYRMHNFREEGRLLDEIPLIDPRNFDGLLAGSAMFGSLGRYDKSEQFSREALVVRPDSPEAWANLGIALGAQAENNPAQSKKMKEAVFAFSRAVKYDPDNARYRDLLARAKREAGGQEQPNP